MIIMSICLLNFNFLIVFRNCYLEELKIEKIEKIEKKKIKK